MTFSYTQIAQYLRCPRSYRYRTSMAGEKKRTAHRCSSAVPSRRPWLPTLRARIAPPNCSSSGQPAREHSWNTPKETTGSAWFAKACSFSNGWLKMTESLSAGGRPSEVHIVKKDAEAGFQSHAWVECEGRMLLCENRALFPKAAAPGWPSADREPSCPGRDSVNSPQRSRWQDLPKRYPHPSRVGGGAGTRGASG